MKSIDLYKYSDQQFTDNRQVQMQMIQGRLYEVAKMAGASVLSGENRLITGVATNSNELVPGNLFVPLTGGSDSYFQVKEALDNGAVAAFWPLDVPNPPAKANLIYVEDPSLALQKLAKSYREKHLGYIDDAVEWRAELGDDIRQLNRA